MALVTAAGLCQLEFLPLLFISNSRLRGRSGCLFFSDLFLLEEPGAKDWMGRLCRKISLGNLQRETTDGQHRDGAGSRIVIRYLAFGGVKRKPIA